MRTLASHFIVLIMVLLLRGHECDAQNAFYDIVALNKVVLKLRERLHITETELPSERLMEDRRVQTQLADFPMMSRFLQSPFEDQTENIRAIRPEIDSLYRLLTGADIATEDLPAEEVRKSISSQRDVGAQLASINLDLSGMGLREQVGAKGVPLSLESRLIYATADLIVDRFQEELSLSFFEHFRESLEDSILQRLLPNTRLFLTTTLDTPLNIPSLGQTWRAAFESDMMDLPVNLTTLCADRIPAEQKDLVLILTGAFDTYTKLRNGMHPAEILHAFALRHGPEDRGRFQNTIVFLDRISWNMLDANRNGWLTPDEMRILEDPPTMKYFIGYLYHLYRPDFDALKIRRSHIDAALPRLSGQLQEMIATTHAIENTIHMYKQRRADGKEFTPADYTGYVRGVFELIAFGYRLTRLSAEQSRWDSTFSNTYVPLSTQVLKSIEAGQQHEYGAVLANTLILLKKVDPSQTLFTQETTSKLLQYGSFMVDVLNAKTIDDTKNAIKAAALPAGSYSLKRKSTFTLGINAYGGMSIGSELLQSASGAFGDGKLHGGMFVPVGVEAAWATGSDWVSSFSVHLSFVDLGAVVNYRIGGERSEAVPNIGFAQVFSPGVFAIFGLGRELPFSFGIGSQYSPKLRSISRTGDVTLSDVNVLKFSAFLAVDIPLFHLVTR